MATLTIRNLPDDVRDRIRVRAARNGRSMEAEARSLLSGAVRETPASASEGDLNRRIEEIQQTLAPYLPQGVNLVDEFLADRRRMWGEE